MLLWSWHHIEAVCLMQHFCRMGRTRGNRVIGERQLAVSLSQGGVWGPLVFSDSKVTVAVLYVIGQLSTLPDVLRSAQKRLHMTDDVVPLLLDV